jgi:hypothetical protein
LKIMFTFWETKSLIIIELYIRIFTKKIGTNLIIGAYLIFYF